jgi:amidase
VSGIVGIKPTVGLVSRYLVIPISEHQDTAGPMAQTVKDVAHLLQVVAGVDPNDNYTVANPAGANLPDYVAACNISGLQGAQIGVSQNVLSLFNYGNSVLQAFSNAISIMQGAGATIINPANFS